MAPVPRVDDAWRTSDLSGARSFRSPRGSKSLLYGAEECVERLALLGGEGGEKRGDPPFVSARHNGKMTAPHRCQPDECGAPVRIDDASCHQAFAFECAYEPGD